MKTFDHPEKYFPPNRQLLLFIRKGTKFFWPLDNPKMIVRLQQPDLKRTQAKYFSLFLCPSVSELILTRNQIFIKVWKIMHNSQIILAPCYINFCYDSLAEANEYLSSKRVILIVP